jgi:uncharacterized membrane protein
MKGLSMDVIEYLFPISSTLHTLAGVIWVGGMFFAHMAMRPALQQQEPLVRLAILSNVLPRFFAWVWLCVIILPFTGYLMVFVDFGGFEAAGYHVTVMHAIGWTMVFIYLFIYFRPYLKFQKAIRAENFPEAGQHFALIRKLIAVNLILGFVVIAAGVSGRFWG